jgi:hypothetical protein
LRPITSGGTASTWVTTDMAPGWWMPASSARSRALIWS